MLLFVAAASGVALIASDRAPADLSDRTKSPKEARDTRFSVADPHRASVPSLRYPTEYERMLRPGPTSIACAYERTGLFGHETIRSSRCSTGRGLDSLTNERGDILLLCDTAGVIVDVKQPPHPQEHALRRAVMGKDVGEVIGKGYMRALSRMLITRPWASLPFRYESPGRPARRCRIVARTVSNPEGRPTGLVVILHGLDPSILEKLPNEFL